MFGGDEVSAVVVDVGYTSCKAGFAGEDNPKAVFPTFVGVVNSNKDSVVGQRSEAAGEKMDVDAAPAASASISEGRSYSIGTNALCFRKDGMEIENPIEDGLVKNWDLVEKLWDHAFKDRLRINSEEHPMLLAAPAIFVAKNAVLSAFSCGRSTALVLDSGGGSTCVAPVHDGYVLQKGVVRSPLSGERLTEYLLTVLENKGGPSIRPNYMLNKKLGKDGTKLKVTEATGVEGTTGSYKRYMQRNIVSDVKETLCRTSESAFDEASHAQMPYVQYELPDGRTLDLGPERFKTCELMFKPETLEAERCGIFGVASSSEMQGLPDCILDCVSKCDTDLKKDLLAAVLITGGNTLFPGFKERLDRELGEMFQQGYKVKIISPMATTERKFSVWIGGSILASLGSFQQMWISKKQYAEEGAQIVHSQCP